MGDQAYSVLVVLPFGTPDAVLRPAEIPPLLAEAIVATEDERFCQHHGFIVSIVQGGPVLSSDGA